MSRVSCQSALITGVEEMPVFSAYNTADKLKNCTIRVKSVKYLAQAILEGLFSYVERS